MREIDILEMRWCPMSKDKTKRRQQTTFLLAMALAPSFTSQWLAFFEVSSVIHSPFVLPPLAPFHRPYVLSLSVFCDIPCLWVLSCISNCSWYSTPSEVTMDAIGAQESACSLLLESTLQRGPWTLQSHALPTLPSHM